MSGFKGRIVYEWSSAPLLQRQAERAEISTCAELSIATAGVSGMELAPERKAMALVSGVDHENERWK